jgi:hypothetical protein
MEIRSGEENRFLRGQLYRAKEHYWFYQELVQKLFFELVVVAAHLFESFRT